MSAKCAMTEFAAKSTQQRAMSLTLRATLLFALLASLVVSAVGVYLYYSL